MITIKKTEWVIGDNGDIVSIPMFGGALAFCKITEVEGDEVSEDGHKALTYKPTGELAKNYILCFLDKTKPNQTRLIHNTKMLCELCDFTDADVPIMDKWLHDFSGVGGGVPITVSDIDIAGTPTIVFGNLAEYYQEMENEELTSGYVEYVKAFNELKSENSDAVLESGPGDLDTYCQNTLSSYQKILREYPGVLDCVNKDMYSTQLLAKIATVIQKRYNLIHFDNVVAKTAAIISNVTYFNDEGKIVPLTLTAVENFLSRVRDSIRIAPITETPTDITKVYRNF